MKIKKLFLGRLKGIPGDCFNDEGYELGTVRKTWDPFRGFDGLLTSFCAEEWERVTGVVLEPGQVVRVNIEVTVR